MKTKDLNRLKVVLVEQKKTAKWLASELKKDPSTVSKWCTNSSQPSLETLSEIANILYHAEFPIKHCFLQHPS